MAFSFEPLLAVFAGHFMAVSAGPEHLPSRSFKIATSLVRGIDN